MNCHKSFKKHATLTGTTSRLETTAERRAKAKMGFVIHLMVFGIISSVQIVQGFASWDFSAIRGLLGWGLGLGIHGLVVFLSHLNLDKQLYEDELRRLEAES